MTGLNGDGPCTDCGTTENIVWFTDNVLWNTVVREVRGREAILCVHCFVLATEGAGYRPTGWRLIPDWPWRMEGQTERAKKSKA